MKCLDKTERKAIHHSFLVLLILDILEIENRRGLFVCVLCASVRNRELLLGFSGAEAL